MGRSGLAHEPLAGRADERHRLGEENAHRIAQCRRLLVRATGRLHLLEGGRGELDGGTQGQRCELLALCLLDALGLGLRELTLAAEDLLRVTAERKEAAALHARSVPKPGPEPCDEVSREA